MPFSWFYIFKLIPRRFRDFIYDLVARNRFKWFGKCNTCVSPK
ncbi:MAG: DUF393 domain-containing protein [Chloroflexia bacterium]|nr:DUF393 domain-containing protein [Chloroflexia bacterium]